MVGKQLREHELTAWAIPPLADPSYRLPFCHSDRSAAEWRNLADNWADFSVRDQIPHSLWYTDEALFPLVGEEI